MTKAGGSSPAGLRRGVEQSSSTKVRRRVQMKSAALCLAILGSKTGGGDSFVPPSSLAIVAIPPSATHTPRSTLAGRFSSTHVASRAYAPYESDSDSNKRSASSEFRILLGVRRQRWRPSSSSSSSALFATRRGAPPPRLVARPGRKPPAFRGGISYVLYAGPPDGREESDVEGTEGDDGRDVDASMLAAEDGGSGDDASKRSYLEEDISRRLRMSPKDRAISALSQPPGGEGNPQQQPQRGGRRGRRNGPGGGRQQRRGSRGIIEQATGNPALSSSSLDDLLPPPAPFLSNEGAPEGGGGRGRGRSGGKKKKRTTMKRRGRARPLSSFSTTGGGGGGEMDSSPSSLLPPLGGDFGDGGRGRQGGGDPRRKQGGRGGGGQGQGGWTNKEGKGQQIRDRQQSLSSSLPPPFPMTGKSSLLPPPLPPLSDYDRGRGGARHRAGSGGGSSWADAATSDAGWGDWFSDDDALFGKRARNRKGEEGGSSSAPSSSPLLPGLNGGTRGGEGGGVLPPLDLKNPKLVDREDIKSEEDSTPSSRSGPFSSPSIGDFLSTGSFSGSGDGTSDASSSRGLGGGGVQSAPPPFFETSPPPPGGLEGVLPVSELFYRSSQSVSTEGMDERQTPPPPVTPSTLSDQSSESLRQPLPQGKRRRDRTPTGAHADEDEGDDEELPFSAEQSDRLSTNGHVRIRRNKAAELSARGEADTVDIGDREASPAAGASRSRYKTDLAQKHAARHQQGQQNQVQGQRKDRRRAGGRHNRRVGAASSPASVGQPGQRGEGHGGKNKTQGGGQPRRRMVRRGMEMLVGGEPINADPPQRFVELAYDFALTGAMSAASTASSKVTTVYEGGTTPQTVATTSHDWAAVAAVNSRDFGPLLHGPSVAGVTDTSRGLYCEHWVDAARRWKICPKDLRDTVKLHQIEQEKIRREKEEMERERAKSVAADVSARNSTLFFSENSYVGLVDSVAPESLPPPPPRIIGVRGSVDVVEPTAGDVADMLSLGKAAAAGRSDESLSPRSLDGVANGAGIRDDEIDAHDGGDNAAEGSEGSSQPRGFGAGRGFGASSSKSSSKSGGKKKSSNAPMSPPSSFHSVQTVHEGPDGGGGNRAMRRRRAEERVADVQFTLGGELKFTLGVTRSELESGHREGGPHGHVLRRVLGRGISAAVNADLMGYDIVIARLVLKEVDGGATDLSVEFQMVSRDDAGDRTAVERAAGRINAALAQAMDDGDMALAMAAAAREEKAWPAKVRDRVVEEFLFENEGGVDEEDEEAEDDSAEDAEGTDGEEEPEEEQAQEEPPKDEYDGPFGMPGDTIYAKDDLYLGGGNSGVFFDYSESASDSSPYHGEIGPLLVDAVAQRALQRQPRVIAIGDVHGCIDELQMLLQRCDYRPGDLVVFLGDLVSKGPDSLSVVQMAREVGAIGVRGNHDFEVIRWHQAIKSGADPPVIGSEHFHIASGLSKADLRWMYSLPWYISSKELGALFVHAGFVSGIRLAKQNPRLMMNMRSILPDGTVTSKFFNNWPWARLWDGPQTVLFGHDADRGLQQYEHAIGLDTGCVYGGRLTACILPEKRLVSVSAKREYFQYRRKHFD